MSAQAAALAASCCCPRQEPQWSCLPTDSSVLVTMPRIQFDFGCRDYIFQCSTGTPQEQLRCCCLEGNCFGNGSPCDSPAWDCRSLRITGSVAPQFVVQMDMDGKYRTRINCQAGINEAYVGGSVSGEEPGCDRLAWPGGGGLTVYRQGAIGQRSCVPDLIIPATAIPCNTGCSSDLSPSVFMVAGLLMNRGPVTLPDGCPAVERLLRIYVEVVSQEYAQDFCQCNPQFVFGDTWSYVTMDYYSYCCSRTPTDGVRGVYRAPQDMLDGAAAPIDYECYGGDRITVNPAIWPAEIVVS